MRKLLIVVALASVPAISLAAGQTAQCPSGFVCTPVSQPAPVCPTGYSCVPVAAAKTQSVSAYPAATTSQVWFPGLAVGEYDVYPAQSVASSDSVSGNQVTVYGSSLYSPNYRYAQGSNYPYVYYSSGGDCSLGGDVMDGYPYLNLSDCLVERASFASTDGGSLTFDIPADAQSDVYAVVGESGDGSIYGTKYHDVVFEVNGQ